MRISVTDVHAARSRIAGQIEATSTVVSASLSEMLDVPVYLKMEHRQLTGSFKLRGALNAVASLSPSARRRGVVTMSTGNHGKALAYAATREGVRAVICMSNMVPSNKVEDIKRVGAEVRIRGISQDEAEEEVRRLVESDGLTLVSPFDDAAVIAGQGTLGLEISEQVQDASVVLVPLSGGGLAAGIAVAMKATNPAVRIVGVSMQRGAAMKASLDAGKPVLVPELSTLADALGGGIGLENRFTFEMCRDLVDQVVLLTEEEIAAGIRHAYRAEKEVIEGAGAVGIGALLARKVEADGPVVAILSGRNIDMASHMKVVNV